MVLKRCVDVDDLLAAASAGQADVAVLGVDTHGLDQAAVDRLRKHAVRPVAVVPDGAGLDAACLRATRIGIRSMVSEAELRHPARRGTGRARSRPTPSSERDEPPTTRHRLAGRGGRVDRGAGVPPGPPVAPPSPPAWPPSWPGADAGPILVDADPYGGAVAQQLGILDEVSGLLAAARVAAGGMLAERFGSVQRTIGPHLGGRHRAAAPRPVGRGPGGSRRAPPRGRPRPRPRGRRHRLQPRAGPRRGVRVAARPQPDDPGRARGGRRDGRRRQRRPGRVCPGWPAGWSSCAT